MKECEREREMGNAEAPANYDHLICFLWRGEFAQIFSVMVNAAQMLAKRLVYLGF